jgi:hypothetical protein
VHPNRLQIGRYSATQPKIKPQKPFAASLQEMAVAKLYTKASTKHRFAGFWFSRFKIGNAQN